ncbi:NAD(P)-dependent oxidoreductase [Mycolicibacterium sp.]|uniref:NAD-dependent epimerase/dehydratase family protein n=1 Tax=Mycolicibacterium sp. TaxID=2320850 RepID=UPI001A1E8899|nr:NAD(P)-dependent oxidoreductase [Mycolicibacterium sp.]MBJ7337660.1 NAD(P)-dependent oxidoreductase [Mycolicibacterium sp.]
MSCDGRGAVAITGANGFIGGALSAAFTAAGYRVVALVRPSRSDGSHSERVGYSLEDGLQRPLPDDVIAVVHCAYDLRERDHSEIERINLIGTQRLIGSIRSIPVVLISSMSAFPGTTQTYGRVKLACEEIATAHGGTSMRLGLVHGGMAGGMVGALRRVAAAPVVPMLRPDPYQYTVHVDDMTRCVVAAVASPPPHAVIGVANPRRVPFSEIITGLRASTTTARLRSLPVPSASLQHILKAAERAGLRIGFRADSLTGLRTPAPGVLHADYWRTMGIPLRDFAAGDASGERDVVHRRSESLR